MRGFRSIRRRVGVSLGGIISLIDSLSLGSSTSFKGIESIGV